VHYSAQVTGGCAPLVPWAVGFPRGVLAGDGCAPLSWGTLGAHYSAQVTGGCATFDLWAVDSPWGVLAGGGCAPLCPATPGGPTTRPRCPMGVQYFPKCPISAGYGRRAYGAHLRIAVARAVWPIGVQSLGPRPTSPRSTTLAPYIFFVPCAQVPETQFRALALTAEKNCIEAKLLISASYPQVREIAHPSPSQLARQNSDSAHRTPGECLPRLESQRTPPRSARPTSPTIYNIVVLDVPGKYARDCTPICRADCPAEV
jgi:hypothetical protein